jgi:hypothetical protein
MNEVYNEISNFSKLNVRITGKENKSLTRSETLVIKQYSSGLYRPLNSALWNDDLEFDRNPLVKSYNTLCMALSKLPKKKSILYRVIDLNNTQLERYKEINSNIIFKGFTSSSHSKVGIHKFRDNSYIKGNVLFIIKSKTAKNISLLAIDPREEEWLFPAGTEFKIMKYTEPFFPWNEIVIELEEV